MHCNVPQNFDKMKGLGGWVNRQRTARAKGTLVQERIDKLDSIDFSWNIKNDAWDIRFDQLIKYKEEHGNCDVPHSYENTELSKWVQKQRYLSTLNSRGTKTNLTDARAAKMTKLGFEWRPSNSSWYGYNSLDTHFSSKTHLLPYLNLLTGIINIGSYASTTNCTGIVTYPVPIPRTRR